MNEPKTPATKARYILRTEEYKTTSLLAEVLYKLAATKPGNVQNWKRRPRIPNPRLA